MHFFVGTTSHRVSAIISVVSMGARAVREWFGVHADELGNKTSNKNDINMIK